MNNDILEQHPCAGKCTDLKEKGDCGHCMVPEKVCLSNSAKNETQSDLSIESGSQFKVGDVVVFDERKVNSDTTSNQLMTIRCDALDNEVRASLRGRCIAISTIVIRLATPAEIKAGHRINFNLNDAVATAFEDMGNDKHIENHVSPQCVFGGDK